MATKLIDFIQSEQIVKLEEDVNILKDKLNLLVADINQLAPKLATIIGNLNTVASSIGNNYNPADLHRHRTLQTGMYPQPGFHTSAVSTDGVLKRLTDFDTYYTEHISKKFPPVVDIKGAVHVGYHVGGTPMEHAHPEGWTGSTGTCLTATASINPNFTYNWSPGGWSNVKFVPLSYNRPDVPTNTTWAGLRLWDAMPTAKLTISGSGSSATITNIDFRLEVFANNASGHKNCSYGFGKSVGDQMMSGYGTMQNGVWQSGFFATVTSVGSQLEARPNDNTPTYRTPHGYLAAYSPTGYGGDSPGVGGPAEPAPPAPSLGASETSTHNIMDESNQLDDQEYITTVLNTGVVPSYLNQAQILFMSDENKIKRAKQLIRMTRNKLRDDSIWQTENVSDGVLTADDFIT